MKKIIRKEDGNYDLIIDERVFSNLKKSFDKRINKNYLWIPEEMISVLNRKFIIESKIDESNELNLEDENQIRRKSSNSSNSSNSSKSSKNSWIDFLNDDERKIYNEIKKELDEKVDRLIKEFDEKVKDLREISEIRIERKKNQEKYEKMKEEMKELEKLLGI